MTGSNVGRTGSCLLCYEIDAKKLAHVIAARNRRAFRNLIVLAATEISDTVITCIENEPSIRHFTVCRTKMWGLSMCSHFGLRSANRVFPSLYLILREKFEPGDTDDLLIEPLASSTGEYPHAITTPMHGFHRWSCPI